MSVPLRHKAEKPKKPGKPKRPERGILPKLPARLPMVRGRTVEVSFVTATLYLVDHEQQALRVREDGADGL